MGGEGGVRGGGEEVRCVGGEGVDGGEEEVGAMGGEEEVGAMGGEGG